VIEGVYAKGTYITFWTNFLVLQDQATLVKQKLSFVFLSTKDLQKISLRKLSSFLHMPFLENKVHINKDNYRMMFFKTS